jgi:AcrR family transcriptional regulator
MKRSDKQIRILEVAEKLFAENGYDGTSIRNISKEAGINIAMISYYFGSKDKLLSALIEFRNSGFTLELENVLSKSTNYTEKLEEIISLIITRINRNRRVYKIIHFQYSRSKDSLFDFETYINQKKKNIKILDNFIKSGQENGAFKKNINSVLIIPTVLGSYFHFYYNKSFFMQLLEMEDEKSFETYIKNELTAHIQQTIKALIVVKQ